MGHSRSIRTSLLGNVLTLVLAAGIAIGGSLTLGTRAIVRRLTGELISQALAHAETRLFAFFEPVTERLGEIRRWSSRGLVDLDDPIGMTRLLAPMVAEMEQVSSIMVADSEGSEVQVMELSAGWRTRHTHAATTWTEYNWQISPDGNAARDDPDLNYDPRSRPWFQGAVDPAALGSGDRPPPSAASLPVWWTEPYTFFTSRAPGITASLAFEDADGRQMVAGLDVLLKDISTFTTQLSVGTSGMVVVVDDRGRVIGLPRATKYESVAERRRALLSRPRDLDLPVVRDASHAFTPALEVDPELATRPTRVSESLRFESGGEAWWGEVRPFKLSDSQQLWIAVLMPERDLLGRFNALRMAVLAVVVASIIIAILQAVALARRFSAPFEALVSENLRLGAGDLEPGVPIDSDVREVRQLADAQDRMRESLRTLVRVERDLAVARQIQQATFPRTLPELEGYDLFGLTRPAEETGGDTYDIFGFRSGGARTVVQEGPADGAVLVLADATGHGVGPALAASQLRAMIRILSSSPRGEELEVAMARINDRLEDDLPENRFITTWVGVLHAATHRLRSFSAGQAPLLHLAAGGEVAHWLDADAPPFGIVAGVTYDPPREITLDPGDLFVVLSDGFYEEPDAEGQQFGSARVLDLIRRNRSRSGSEIIAALREAVEAHTGGAPPKDDRTAVIIRRHN